MAPRWCHLKTQLFKCEGKKAFFSLACCYHRVSVIFWEGGEGKRLFFQVFVLKTGVVSAGKFKASLGIPLCRLLPALAGLPEPSKWLGRRNPQHLSKMWRGGRGVSFQKSVFFLLVFNESLVFRDRLEKVLNWTNDETASHRVPCTQSEPAALRSFLGSAGVRIRRPESNDFWVWNEKQQEWSLFVSELAMKLKHKLWQTVSRRWHPFRGYGTVSSDCKYGKIGATPQVKTYWK